MNEKTNEPKKIIRDAKAQEAYDKKMAAAEALIPSIKAFMENHFKPEVLREMRAHHK